MKIISYAQNYEDVLLNRLFPDRPGGFYIDVGACHPVFHSVTKLFYERGWQGINIEPVPRMFELLADARPRDVNLHMGLSNLEGNLTFYEVPDEIGSSTFAEEHAEGLRRKGHRLEERSILVTTLARVCELYAGETIDFLKIDVESHEREVLEGGLGPLPAACRLDRGHSTGHEYSLLRAMGADSPRSRLPFRLLRWTQPLLYPRRGSPVSSAAQRASEHLRRVRAVRVPSTHSGTSPRARGEPGMVRKNKDCPGRNPVRS